MWPEMSYGRGLCPPLTAWCWDCKGFVWDNISERFKACFALTGPNIPVLYFWDAECSSCNRTNSWVTLKATAENEIPPSLGLNSQGGGRRRTGSPELWGPLPSCTDCTHTSSGQWCLHQLLLLCKKFSRPEKRPVHGLQEKLCPLDEGWAACSSLATLYAS